MDLCASSDTREAAATDLNCALNLNAAFESSLRKRFANFFYQQTANYVRLKSQQKCRVELSQPASSCLRCELTSFALAAS